MQYHTILCKYHIVPYKAVQYCTIQYNTLNFNKIPCNTIQYHWIQHNTAFALCKTRLPNLARDELSDHDSKNCSDVKAVTWFRICPGLAENCRKQLEIGTSRGSKLTSAFCKTCLPNLARDKLSDHDSENCSGVSGIAENCRKRLEIGSSRGSKSTSAFCKIRLSNLARDESSNHNSENCSEISAVTWFRLHPGLAENCRKWL